MDPVFLNPALEHAKISDLTKVIVIFSAVRKVPGNEPINDSPIGCQEEIWYPEFFMSDRIVKDVTKTANKNFGWGEMGLGTLTILGKKVPSFYTQSASPVGFYIDISWLELVEKLPPFYYIDEEE